MLILNIKEECFVCLYSRRCISLSIISNDRKFEVLALECVNHQYDPYGEQCEWQQNSKAGKNKSQWNQDNTGIKKGLNGKEYYEQHNPERIKEYRLHRMEAYEAILFLTEVEN